MGAKKIQETTSEADLIQEVSRVITELTGVQLGPKQYTLVQGRLAKRMRDLKLAEPLEYARYYNANESIEIGILTSLLTTHHTFFFREFQHFEYILKVSLPILIKSHREKGLKTIRIWSAACSRGQEVYSMTMFLKHHLPLLAPEMDYEVLGSDICEESISIATNGVYPWDELRVVPSVYLQGQWQKGSGNIANFVRAKDDIRKGTSFRILNLQDLSKNPFGSVPAKFDIILCRNVFIYFNHAQIKAITEEMLKILNPMGHLFVGLSESLNGLGLPIEWVGPSVYEPRKTKKVSPAKVLPIRPQEAVIEAKKAPPPIISTQPEPAGGVQVYEAPTAMVAKKIRVLCVDDSPTVLLLLKRMLSSDKGFEICGTAVDGLDALEKCRKLKPDIMTLDIHMPQMTGVEFLEKHFKELQVPVVIVSSVPRDDATLAFRCLEVGASDYIEKPSAQNLSKVEEELIFKLRVAVEAWRQSNDSANGTLLSTRALELDASFKRSPQIIKPDGKFRLLLCSFSTREIVTILMKGFRGVQPPTLVLIDGGGEILGDWIASAAPKITGARIHEPIKLRELQAGSVSFMDMEKGMQMFAREGYAFKTSCLIVGPVSKSMTEKIISLSVNDIIMEDRGLENPHQLLSKSRLVVPLTSFVYESDRFLADGDSGSGGEQ